MRTVVNISLSKPLSEVVEKAVTSGRYVSKSEIFRSLLRLWLESELGRELEESRIELRSGEGKLLKSLKTLR